MSGVNQAVFMNLRSFVPAYELYAWGDNNYGKLGLNITTSSDNRLSSPVQVGALTTWIYVSPLRNHIGALKTDGTMWSWGKNNYGQLGTNNRIFRSSPVQIGALTEWYDIAASQGTTFAIKTNGTMWSWGSNYSGNLGTNNRIDRSSPVQIGSLTTWDHVWGGSASCFAIKTDGTMWSWGENSRGGLGLNDIIFRSSPVQIGSLSNWAIVTVDNDSCLAIKTDGTMWSWGSNYSGQLGLDDTVARSSPVQIGALTNWSQASRAGLYCCVAIKTDGTMWSWGSNQGGRLGQNLSPSGAGGYRSSPIQIGALTNWAQVGPSSGHCLAIKTDGTLWSWGDGGAGQLGTSTIVNRSSPVQVGALDTWIYTSAGNACGFGITKT
jgi:alpha-tubulin suppressor-like RCC1 family protein